MLNRVVLIGRICHDIDLKKTASGISVVSFRIAVDRNYTPKGSERQTDFISIVAWRNTAEFVQKYFSKGSMIAIEGSIQTRQYTDNAGNNRTAFEVVADQVYFAGGKNDSEPKGTTFTPPQSNDSTGTPPPPASFSVGDIGDFEEIPVDDGNLPF